MSEELRRLMENISITAAEEEDFVTVEDGVDEEISRDESHCLIGKLLIDRSFNLQAFQMAMQRAWNLGPKVTIRALQQNLFLFCFDSSFRLQKVVRGGPWSFMNHRLLLRPLEKEMTIHSVSFPSAAFWVQVHGLPIKSITEKMGWFIGGKLGQCIEVDTKNGGRKVGAMLRIRVNIDIAQPLRRWIKAVKDNGTHDWAPLKYERLPSFCFFCGRLGHTDRECEDRFNSGTE